MFDRIYDREYYLDKLRGFYQSDLIKVITGIRRCGKSSLLQSVVSDLKKRGVTEKDIIFIDLDSRDYMYVTDPESLAKEIDSRDSGGFKYLFIDEVQNVEGFETLINAYRQAGRFSIFITGSNSYLLSGELATKLTGRYIELELFPLNFREMMEMKCFLGKKVRSPAEEFAEYLRFGGFPQTLEFDDEQDKLAYVENIVSQIIDKDIRSRAKIRSRSVFDKVMNYLINNYGATTSLSGLVEYFRTVEHVAVTRETLDRYIKLLLNAKILYRCPRFDVKSKRALRGEEKYYLADLSLYFARNVDGRINYGPALENVMYVYLSSKDYRLSVGRVGKLECDFIARRGQGYTYIQIAMTIADPQTEEREYRPFRSIRDNFPKYLFTLDPLPSQRDGIRHCNLIDFIMSDADF